MARQVKLTADQLEELQEAARCTVRPGIHTQLLSSLGLTVNGTSRFGGWVKATEAGRAYLERAVKKAVPPKAASGPAKAGILLRGAAPRKRRAAATNAR